MLPVDRKKRHKICKKTQIFRHFLRQLKQALGLSEIMNSDNESANLTDSSKEVTFTPALTALFRPTTVMLGHYCPVKQIVIPIARTAWV
jgi:hypothetical protein